MSPEHVHEFRKFIEAGRAQPGTKRWESVTIWKQCTVRTAGIGHRTELDDLEDPLVSANAKLPEQHRPAEITRDRGGGHRHHRRGDRERGAGPDDVERALGDTGQEAARHAR